MPQRVSRTFQARRALLRYLAPRYQQASPAQKTLLLDSFVEWTGYTRKYAIALLNHGEHDQQTIQRRRLPQYRQAVQQALFLAWKAAHYVCAKRLLPSLPSLVALLEGHGHCAAHGRRAPPVARHECLHSGALLAHPTQTPPAWPVHDHSRSVVQGPDPGAHLFLSGRRIALALWKWIWWPIVGTISMGVFSIP